MERAYSDARTRATRASPSRVLIPSTGRSESRAAGKHVRASSASIHPTLPGGRSWDEEKEAAQMPIVATVEPGTPRISEEHPRPQNLSPLDLEREFGLIGGDIFHRGAHARPAVLARPCSATPINRSPCADSISAVPRASAAGDGSAWAQRSARDPQRFPARLDAASECLRRRSGELARSDGGQHFVA